MSRLGATEETAVACCALVMSILDECSVLAAPAGAGKLEQGSRRICRGDEETRLRSDLSSLLRLSAGARVGIPRASAMRMGLSVAEGMVYLRTTRPNSRLASVGLLPRRTSREGAGGVLK